MYEICSLQHIEMHVMTHVSVPMRFAVEGSLN